MDRKRLAYIHILKKKLNLSDSQYRDILQRIVHVRSAKELTEKQFIVLMSYFTQRMHEQFKKEACTEKQKTYIQQLVKGLGWSDEHCENFLHKYYHKKHIAELNKREARNVIESLKNVYTHQK